MAALSLEIEGEARFRRAVESLIAAQKNWKPIWPSLEKEFYEIERRQFDTQGQGRWPALSPAYAKAKAVEYPGRPIMRRDGFLRESLTTPGAYADAVREFTDTDMEIGTTLPYAALHQKGRGRLPQRKIIDLSARDHARMNEIAAQQFERIGTELGFEVYT